MIVAFSGLAGVGKDTAADVLVREKAFVKVALADPLKRICADVFDFSTEQLWGPSNARNAPDKRYPRGRHLDQDQYVDLYLTPRHALQKLGTEFGRDCYDPVWVEYGLRTAKKLLAWNEQGAACGYDPQKGLKPAWKPAPGVVFSDIRFKNEVAAFKAVGAKLVRILRTGGGLAGAAGLHQSEQEQLDIPDTAFDAVILNDGTLEEFYPKVLRAVFG